MTVAAFMFLVAMTEWMSLGMIAVSKCIGLLQPQLGEKLFSGLTGMFFLAMTWIYGHVVLIPEYVSTYYEPFKVSKKFLSTNS